MHTEEQRKKMSEKKIGENNPNWKGLKVQPHWWIKKLKGEANNYICEICKIKRAYDWSNKDHKYNKDIKDWQAVCRGCHKSYDSKLKKKRKIKK